MNTQLISRYRAASRVASIVVLAVGLLVLMGWLFDIPSLKSAFPGLAFVLAGYAGT